MIVHDLIYCFVTRKDIDRLIKDDNYDPITKAIERGLHPLKWELMIIDGPYAMIKANRHKREVKIRRLAPVVQAVYMAKMTGRNPGVQVFYLDLGT